MDLDWTPITLTVLSVVVLALLAPLGMLLNQRHPLPHRGARRHTGPGPAQRVRSLCCTAWNMKSWLNMSFGRDRPQGPLPPAEKLKQFYDLAKDALEQAYQADTSGVKDKAVKGYRIAVQAIDEALRLPVQGSGLGPVADTITSWKNDLHSWHRPAAERLRYLESGAPAAGSSPPRGQGPEPVRPMQRNLAVQSSILQAAVPQAGRPAAAVAAQQRRRTTNSSDGGGAGVRQAGRAAAAAAAGRTKPVAMPAGGGAAAAAAPKDKEDQKYRELIMNEILDNTPSVRWDDIAGLQTAKQALQEAVILPALRPDLFTGPLRAPVRGILLYGPPGNGKTMLGKALAHEAQARFFAISASSLTSKWVGEAEKLVRALFAVAAEQAPSIIFMDEIDSILGARGGSNEHDSARRLKTEFLVQFDGVASSNNDRVVVIGATNRPHEIDDAVRRRLVRRIYIPLPGEEGRAAILSHLLKGQAHTLSSKDFSGIIRATDGYSASDLTALCKEAAMAPLRELPPSALARIAASSLRPIKLADFAAALGVIKPSVNRDMLRVYDDFTKEFGSSA